MVAALKLGEEHKQKSYVATCRLSAPPDPERLAALNASTDILVRKLVVVSAHLQSNSHPMMMAVPLPARMPSCAKSPGADEFFPSDEMPKHISLARTWAFACRFAARAADPDEGGPAASGPGPQAARALHQLRDDRGGPPQS